jgi:uncharacterized protein YkwD
MGWLFRLVGGLIRTVVVIVLIAVILLAGLTYLDNSGIVPGKVNQVLADTVGPQVATAVENGGGTVLGRAGDVLRGLLSQADQALAQQGLLALPSPQGQGTPDATSEADARALLDLINQYRESKGLKPWSWDDRLATFGQWRADDMIARNYFSHNDPKTGEILLARLPTLVSVGENLFQVSGPAVRFMRNINGEVLKGWQNSPAHNELLLAPTMTRAGLAFARTDTRIISVLIAAE